MRWQRVEPVGSELVLVAEFGLFDALSDRAHRLYIDGFSERAVLACREATFVTTGVGDRATTRFLHYIEGIALQEVGRHHEAVTAAMDLLEEVEDEPDRMWRAKALALLAESSIQVGEVSRAMDALAEGAWLVANTTPGRYSHLSASMAVALAMRAVYLFEQADELMAAIRLGDDVDIDMLVVQERALLLAFWGTTLRSVGESEAAGPHLVRCAESALRLGRLAALSGSAEMCARAEVIEAYALSRLGYVELAAARVGSASLRFRLRDELVETQLVHLVLGQAATHSGDFPEARRHLGLASDNADRTGRNIWGVAATEAMAEVETVAHGQHPGVDLWKRLAREALYRVWVERDGRFTSLQSRNQVRALTAETYRIGQAALLDPLTGLGNRQLMAGTVDADGVDLSAVFVDVDQFKLVNDRFSHAIGDDVLRRVAIILRSQCRADDVVIRYGGDEFVILVLAGGAPAPAGGTVADDIARRVHHAVRSAPWAEIAPGLTVTVSVGVGRETSSRGAVASADAALYAAKNAGRDRVVVG